MTRLEKILTAFGTLSLSIASATAYLVGGDDLSAQVNSHTVLIQEGVIIDARQDSLLASMDRRLTAETYKSDHILCLVEAIAAADAPSERRRSVTQCAVDYGSVR